MKKTGAKRFSTTGDGLNIKRLSMSSLFGAIAGIVILFLILIAFSSICTVISNPHPLIFPLSIFAIYSSAFFAGLLAVKRNGSANALLCGGLCGALLLLLLILISTIIPSEQSSNAPFFLKLITLPMSIFGSFIGRSSGTKRKKRNF